MFEPHGIYGQWRKIRQFFSEFPLYRKATHKRQKTYLRTERVR
jgi:branched-chain amino acid transport system permease protein